MSGGPDLTIPRTYVLNLFMPFTCYILLTRTVQNSRMKTPERKTPMKIFLHQPGLFRSANRYRISPPWTGRHSIGLHIYSMEIFRSRSTRHNPCDENSVNYDENFVMSTLQDVGCKPYYFDNTFARKFNQCTSWKEMDTLNRNFALKYQSYDNIRWAKC